MYPFLFFILIFFTFPVAVLGILFRRRLLKYKRTILWSLIFVFTFGFLWDWIAYKTGVWRYDTAKTLDIWIGGLPIEEFIGFYVFGTLLIAFTVIIIHEKIDSQK